MNGNTPDPDFGGNQTTTYYGQKGEKSYAATSSGNQESSFFQPFKVVFPTQCDVNAMCMQRAAVSFPYFWAHYFFPNA